MRGVSFEGIAADVVAGQGGLCTGVAQQMLDVAQRDALIESQRADGAAQRVRADGTSYAGDTRAVRAT
jgi:hypothetical protein